MCFLLMSTCCLQQAKCYFWSGQDISQDVRLVKYPRLTPEHRHCRHMWVHMHENKNPQHCSYVLISLGSASITYDHARVCRRASGRLVDCCIQVTDVICAFPSMVWGAFHVAITSDLVAMDGMTSQQRMSTSCTQIFFPVVGQLIKKICVPVL